jgi:hypothetical protein
MSLPTTTERCTPSPTASLPSQYDRESTTVGSDSEDGKPGKDDPTLRSITEDLEARIVDWKGYPLSSLGLLQLYNHLHIWCGKLHKDRHVYLFKVAIIFATEELKCQSWVQRYLPQGSRGALILKGRIFIRHINAVADTSTLDELSLTVNVGTNQLENFKMVFKDRQVLELWYVSSYVYDTPMPSGTCALGLFEYRELDLGIAIKLAQ